MKKISLLLFSITIAILTQAQQYHSGCLIDEEAYARIPVKAKQLTRSYASLPRKAMLLEYCPTPGNQGVYQTCTSWAIAYAGRTILEAQATGCTDPATNAKEAFSPTFVYAKIKDPSAYDCQAGTYIEDGLRLLKNVGVPKKSVFYEDCASSIPAAAYENAKQYKIEDYFTLFNSTAPAQQRIEATKMALSQGRPVIISMPTYNSFCQAGAVWNGVANYSDGYHCMCVVGYDDDKYGGAFLFMNSWGTYWGENGFTWVRYNDYGREVRFGYEMYLGKKTPQPQPQPQPQPKPQPATLTLSGSLSIILATGETMSANLSTDSGLQVYKVNKSYSSGTRYRILLSNNEPAYVYVLGSDNTGVPELLFPPTPQISPALVYATNNIAIPDENWYIETDNTVGTDYLCVLYSQTELPIYDIVSRINASQGSFSQKLVSVLGAKLVPNSETSFDRSSIAFSTSSDKTVVPIIVEIPHGK